MKHNSPLHWLLMLACLIPLGILLFTGGSISSGWGSILLFVGLMLVCHFFMMQIMHGEEHVHEKRQNKSK